MGNTHCSKSRFNYCKWAKTLVAIPALPIIGYTAASFFHTAPLQILAAGIAITLAVYGAIWLDKVPALQKKFTACGCTKKD